MAFKKLDSDAVSSTDSRALDAFVLQGEDANLRQAHEDRGRAVAHSYASDSRPVLASPWRSAVPLSPFPVSQDCAVLSVQVRGLATVATGETNAIRLNLAAQKIDGSVLDTGPVVTVAGSASAQTVDLTIDARPFDGLPVVLWLVFSSQEQTSTPGTGTQAGSDITAAGSRIKLNSVTPFTFSSAKRWRLTFDEDAAGATSPEGFGYAGPRMIQSLQTTNVYRVIPSLPESLETYAHFQVTVDEIGFFELYGWSITETAFDSLPALQLAPGGRLRARQSQELYRRGYRLASHRTRLYSGATARNRTNHPGNLYFPSSQSSVASIAGPWYIVAVGDLPTVQTQEDSSTPATVYRRRYRALVCFVGVAASSARNAYLKGTIDAELNTFGGTTWATNAITPTERNSSTIAPMLVIEGREQITAPSLYNPRANDAYYFWNFGDVLAGASGLRLIDSQFEEDAAQQAITARLLEINLSFVDEEGRPPDLNTVACFPCALVMVDEGF